MIRFVLRVLGVPVLAIDTIHYEMAGDEDETVITAGSTHNFERDVDPLTATSHHEWEWEEKKRFGFQ